MATPPFRPRPNQKCNAGGCWATFVAHSIEFRPGRQTLAGSLGREPKLAARLNVVMADAGAAATGTRSVSGLRKDALPDPRRGRIPCEGDACEHP
jgi:hypothetical protein